MQFYTLAGKLQRNKFSVKVVKNPKYHYKVIRNTSKREILGS